MSPMPTTTTPYPAISKQATGEVDGITTDVMSVAFADKIMVTISQGGRLAQWVHVPLDSSDINVSDRYLPSSPDDNALLPLSQLTPKTLLGGSTAERETLGQLYATQIASTILMRSTQEKRTLVVGLGLSKFEASQQAFYDTLDLVIKCL